MGTLWPKDSPISPHTPDPGDHHPSFGFSELPFLDSTRGICFTLRVNIPKLEDVTQTSGFWKYESSASMGCAFLFCDIWPELSIGRPLVGPPLPSHVSCSNHSHRLRSAYYDTSTVFLPPSPSLSSVCIRVRDPRARPMQLCQPRAKLKSLQSFLLLLSKPFPLF